MATEHAPPDDTAAAPHRTRGRLTRDGSRLVSARLTAPDRERLARALDGRELGVSGFVRSLILRDLDALDAGNGTAPV